MQSKSSAIIPPASERLPCRRLDSPHPAVVDPSDLLERCQLRTQRRSGPGGQHRNKTSSGAFLTHSETGIIGEATERRSQAQNRDVALQRLRYLLAIEIRTHSPLDPNAAPIDRLEEAMRRSFHGYSMKFNENNPDKPAVLALVLNDLWIAGGQPSLVSELWSVSTSKLVQMIRSVPASLMWVNELRSHHGRYPLH